MRYPGKFTKVYSVPQSLYLCEAGLGIPLRCPLTCVFSSPGSPAGGVPELEGISRLKIAHELNYRQYNA